MSDAFFSQPILNSPYQYPSRHWELDEHGQPTGHIAEGRRKASFLTPIPKPKKQSKAQIAIALDEGKGLSTGSQQYDIRSLINELRIQVDRWRSLPDPSAWQVTPETARLLQHWRHHQFAGIRRDDGARFFEPGMRESLLDGQFWAEADAGRTGLGAIERDLRENVLGEEAWNGLDLSTRTFIATAEQIFRTNRGDAGFDFSGVVVNLAKALEVQVVTLVRRALAGATEPERTVVLDGRSIDVTKSTPLSLGTLGRVLSENKGIREALRPRLINGDWLLTSGGKVLQRFSQHRNPAAHSQVISRERARQLRNQLLGIGSHGELVHLAATRPR